MTGKHITDATATQDAVTQDAATQPLGVTDQTAALLEATPDAATQGAVTQDAVTPDPATQDAATQDAVTPPEAPQDATTPDATTPDATTPDAAPGLVVLRAAKAAKGARRRALLLRCLVYGGAGLTAVALLTLVGYILVLGVPHLSWDLFALPYNSLNVSLMPALINTLLMMALSLLIAVPLGLGAAIYLVEYTGRGNKLVGIVRTTAETLTGIPSIVYGLFGMLFFVTALGWRLSLLAGACTLAIMILPIIMRTAEEALAAVPDSFREGSFGLGAGRLRTVTRILLPSAMPGILAGVILGIGRIVGESAALIYTAGSVTELPASVFDSTRTLSVHMYVLASEGLHLDKTYATAVVLLVIVLAINTLSALVARRITASHDERRS